MLLRDDAVGCAVGCCEVPAVEFYVPPSLPAKNVRRILCSTLSLPAKGAGYVSRADHLDGETMMAAASYHRVQSFDF